jgi:hypothetical protein
MVAIAHTPQEVLNALTAADWADLGHLVDRLNAHPVDLVDWVAPEEFFDDEWPQEIPLFAHVAEEAIEFIYRCLTFRDGRRVGLSEIRRYADEFVNLMRKPARELSCAEAITRISVLAENDHRVGDAFAYSFDSGEIVELLERLLEFRQQKAA